MSDLGSIAFHEAGHAVIGRVMRQACGYATIVPDEDEGTFGFSETFDHWTTLQLWEDVERYREPRQAMVGRIVTFLAGRHAELQGTGAMGAGYDDDIAQASLMAVALGYEDEVAGSQRSLGAFLDRLDKVAASSVARHCGAIERVANALLQRSTLSGDEIDVLIS